MRNVNIDGHNIEYLKKGDPINLESLDTYKTNNYKIIFAWMDDFCKKAHIECPDLALVDELINMNTLELMGGELYSPKDFPHLDNNLIVISLYDKNYEKIQGVLFHEIRHVWQHKYNPEIDAVHAHGFIESLNHPAEIDADGFAIFYLSLIKGITFEEAADIICHNEKSFSKDAYQARINKAVEIKTNYRKTKTHWKKFKELILSGIYRINERD